jgi:hypothetical protein
MQVFRAVFRRLHAAMRQAIPRCVAIWRWEYVLGLSHRKEQLQSAPGVQVRDGVDPYRHPCTSTYRAFISRRAPTRGLLPNLKKGHDQDYPFAGALTFRESSP